MSSYNQAYGAPLGFERRTVVLSACIHVLVLFGLLYCYREAIQFVIEAYNQSGARLPAMARAFFSFSPGLGGDATTLPAFFALALVADVVLGMIVLWQYAESGRRNWSNWVVILMLGLFAFGIVTLLIPIRGYSGM